MMIPKVRSSLILKIAAPVIILVMVLGVSLYILVLPTISGFVKNRIEHDLRELSHRIYNVCDKNLTRILMAGKADNPRALLINQALTLGEIEDLFRQESLNGFVYSSTESELLAKTGLPADPDEIMRQVSQQGTLVSLIHKAKGHYAYGFDFSPWNWQVIIMKDKNEYADLITKVRNAHIYTLCLLALSTVLLVFFLYQTIKRPINAIVKPLRNGRRPRYKGVDAFEYLSVTISQMMNDIRKSEDKYRSLVETTSDFVWEVDKKGRFTYASQAIKEMLGYTPEEVAGKSALELMTPDEAKRATEKLRPYVKNEKRFDRLENILKHKKGHSIVLETSGVPVFDDNNKFTGFRGIDRDITERLNTEKERKKLEIQIQQLQKLESIGTLAGGIAHDFNNLLAVIMGNISLADYKITHDTGIRQFLNEAEKASSKAQELTHQLITFAKGGAPITEVGPITRLLEDTIGQAVSSSDISCNFTITNNLWLVDIDGNQIRHALKNIAANAIDAMPNGGCINVTAENLDMTSIPSDQGLPLSRRKYVRIQIKDTGAGIPEKNIPLVFDPYFSTKEKGNRKGMGLGLAITYSIINRHEGHIRVESNEGKGSTFDLFFPAYKQQKDIFPPEQPYKPGMIKSPTQRILVMDDEKMIRTIAKQILSQMGYKVSLARDGDQAVKRYRESLTNERPFDIVILDLTVKDGMGGKETIKKLIEADNNVRAIVSSGYSNDPAMTNFTAFGFTGTLPKPYSMRNLKDAIDAALLHEKPQPDNFNS